MEKLNISKSIVCYNLAKFNQGGDLRKYINSGKLFALVLKMERVTGKGNIIVLGGDGTMLKAIKYGHSEKKPVLGVNFGNKGFLLNSIKDIEKNFEFEISEYSLLECDVQIGEKKITQYAFNEVDFRANTGKIIDLDIELDTDLKTNLKGDGFVFSTPAGSTGYNFSLGGPILPHSQKSFILTPKAPWLPRAFRSIIIDNEKIITIKNKGRLSDIKIICDGKDFFETKGKEITVTIKKAETTVEVLIPKEMEVAWKDKIFLEQGFEKIKK